MKFVLVLLTLPSLSFCSVVITSFFGRLERQANFPTGRRLLGGGGFGCLVRCESGELDFRNFSAGSARLHHFVKPDDLRIGTLRVEK